MGTLFLVSTPIGNLEDITLRALRVLREVALIAAEDTRHTRRLLDRYDIQTSCISYHEHNKLARLDTVLATLASGDVALVSDAGTPALSDPGFELVRACIDAGFHVSPVPGPSAPVAALVTSGLPTDRFYYLGFLPRRRSERRALFASVATIPASLVCFESPHRLAAALDDMLDELGDRTLVVARELTKLHEELLRLPISATREHFRAQRPRGEFTLVIEGMSRKGGARPVTEESAAAEAAQPAADAPDPAPVSEATIIERLRELRAAGASGSSAARTVARELDVPRRTAYHLWTQLTEDDTADAQD